MRARWGAERCGKREEPLLYHLRGVIVHKGEASHGHYYAFMHKPGMGWFRVDDEKVVSFDLDKGLVHKPCSSTPIGPALPTGGAGSGLGAAGREVSGFAVGGGKGLEGLAALAEECFGGVDSASKVRAGKKARNHNAFVLFYERTSDSGTHPPMAGIEDVNSSSSSDAAHSPAPHATDAEKAVKELQSALQSLPDHRDYGLCNTARARAVDDVLLEPVLSMFLCTFWVRGRVKLCVCCGADGRYAPGS